MVSVSALRSNLLKIAPACDFLAVKVSAVIVFAVMVLAVFTLSACRSPGGMGTADSSDVDSAAVQVDKEAPKIETKVFTLSQAKARARAGKRDPLAMDVEAYTEWFYSCKATFDTEDVRQDDTNGAASVALRVKGLKFTVALPITVHLPKNAPAALKEHEDGHVLICSLVYGLSGKVAAAAGKQVLGRTFEGMGKDMAEARLMALDQAQKIVARAYQEGTNDLAEQMSRKYDELCQRYADEPKMSRESLARAAYNELADVPQTVIK